LLPLHYSSVSAEWKGAMPWLRRHAAARRVGAVVQLALFLSGCLSWRAEPTSPADLMVSRKPSVVRITQPDSSRLILRDPVVQGDTLYGRPQANLKARPKARTGIALADVKGIATLKLNPAQKTLLGVGIAVTALCLLGNAFGCGDDRSFLEAATSAK
jgi:hypothetical protein